MSHCQNYFTGILIQQTNTEGRMVTRSQQTKCGTNTTFCLGQTMLAGRQIYYINVQIFQVFCQVNKN